MKTTLTHTADGKPESNNVCQILTNSHGRMVAYGQMTPDDAKRLAACWNKFTGMDIRLIEAMPKSGVLGLAFEQAASYTQIRELAKAVKVIEMAATDDEAWAEFREEVLSAAATKKNATPAH